MSDVRLGRWRHWKGGDYDVIAVAFHARTAESVVIYQSAHDPKWTWARDVEEFLGSVEIEPSLLVPRFTYVRPDPAGANRLPS